MKPAADTVSELEKVLLNWRRRPEKQGAATYKTGFLEFPKRFFRQRCRSPCMLRDGTAHTALIAEARQRCFPEKFDIWQDSSVEVLVALEQ